MGVSSPERPSDFEPAGGLAVAIQELDTSRSELFASVVSYAGKPSDEAMEATAEAASKLSLTFENAVRAALAEDASTEQQANIIAALLKHEDTERVTCLNELSRKRDYKAIRKNVPELTKEIQKTLEIAEDQTEAVEVIVEQFDGWATTDFSRFFHESSNTLTIRLMRASRYLGKHAIDVGKIGIGVSAGAAIAHYAHWH